MNEAELPDNIELELLHGEAKWLRETIADIDRSIAAATRSYLNGGDVSDDALVGLQTGHQARHEYVFRLSQVGAQMEKILERIGRSQAPSQEDIEQQDALAAVENQLDWLDVGDTHTPPDPEDGYWQEPERYDR